MCMCDFVPQLDTVETIENINNKLQSLYNSIYLQGISHCLSFLCKEKNECMKIERGGAKCPPK